MGRSITECKQEGVRNRGLSKLVCMNGFREELIELGIKGKWMVAKDRN